MNKKTIIKLGVLLILIIFLAWLNVSVIQVNPSAIQGWVLSFGFWAPLIYILLYTLRPLVLFPASVMSMAGGLAFGPWLGVMLNMAGAIGGAALSFFVARLFGKNIAGKEWSGRAKVIQEELKEHGFLYLLTLRLIPVLNFDLVSYVAGVSKIRFLSYLAATALGIIPGAFAYTFLGAGLVSGDFTIIFIGFGLIVLVSLLPFLLKRLKRSRQAMQELEGSESR
ncbi:TVP38/TMEM64 family protein [Thalassorhabdus alkalitolerans]|uniref:TVP38/TMEM64 family membrane protein n=1 Tax=Thalassorhabdus alkalitolerans TaxID=2282697 RepID=A0ABW0YTF2_9BACI